MDATTWPYPPELEAALAAPQSHRLMLETAAVRVYEVVIPPGVREPEHTHRCPSVMVVTEAAAFRYFVGDGLLYEGDAHWDEPPQALWMDPEGPHAIENVDDRTYRAFRIELKS